jgi:hypothetical protein
MRLNGGIAMGYTTSDDMRDRIEGASAARDRQRRDRDTATRSPRNAAQPGGVVVCYSNGEGYNPRSHECVTRALAANKLAALKGYGFGGEYESGGAYAGGIYFVPSRTLVGGADLGIRDADDLFGGVVPYGFVGTKTITHPVIDERARVPEGWSHEFAAAVAGAVLDGYAAFSVEDAMRAGAKLLERGPVRVKPALALGGRGQVVASDRAELKAAVEGIDASELRECGLALEQNLSSVTTYSVGQVRVADLVATYYGTQLLTKDNRGIECYGGSHLTIVRGDFDALLALDMPEGLRSAVEHAQVYDTAAHACYPGFFASRRNYDIVEGRDADNALRCGVLEQSWRIGGASGAEIAALECFRADPQCTLVRARCIELYGESVTPPADATLYFRGEDEKVGFITKYTVVDKHADA